MAGGIAAPAPVSCRDSDVDGVHWDNPTAAPPSNILSDEFVRIQQLIGRTLTWDSYADDSGSRALCRRFSCPASPFTATDIAGHVVWLHTPDHSLLLDYIRHYLHCKRRAPASTTACILVPRSMAAKCRRLLPDAVIVRQYKPSEPLFTLSPPGMGQQPLFTNSRWEVWFDPPDASVCAPALTADAASPTCALTHVYALRIGSSAAVALMDSGASHVFVRQPYISSLGISAQPCQYPQVALADGASSAILGQCRIKLRFPVGFTSTVTALVLPALPEGVDIILGDEWQTAHSVVLDSEARTCLVRKGERTFTLSAVSSPDSAISDGAKIMNYVCHRLAERTSPFAHIISMHQAKKLIRAGAHSALFYVKADWVSTGPMPAATAPAHGSSGTWMCCPKACSAGSIPPASATPTPAAAGLMQPARLRTLLDEYADVFQPPKGLPPDRGVDHTIPTVPHRPIFRNLYRMSKPEQDECRRQVADLLEKGFIRPSISPYGAPVLFVAKKDGSLRMVIDYRALNAVTIRNRYPLPRIDDMIDRMAGKTIFSSLDLHSGYHQIAIKPEDIPLTAFNTPFGHYEFLTLPFGLSNSGASFQALMDRIFAPYLNKWLLVYIDDIAIMSNSPEEHEQHLRTVFDLLRLHKLQVRRDKCEFNQPELVYLGHIVGRAGVRMDPRKIEAVRAWPTPTSATELRQFLGLTNYFRRFIQGYSSLVAPLIALLKDGITFSDEWCSRHDQAFQAVRRAVTSAPVLTLPVQDQPFELVCDASLLGTGAVLLQGGRPVAFRSAKFSPAERNYTTGDQEFLAVFQALKEWRCYCEGADLTIVSDHAPLQYLQSQANLSRRQARWMEYLSRFHHKWEYRPGRTNVADPLSRSPLLSAIVANILTRRQQAAARADPVVPAHTAGPGPGADEPQRPAAPADEQSTARPSADRRKRHKPAPSSTVASPPSDRRESGSSEFEPSLLFPTIKAGYEADDWFLNKRHTRKLRLGDNGLWYRRSATDRDQVVIPNSTAIKRQILYEFHDAPSAGHPGRERTKELVSRCFWWPAWSKDVEDYVANCDSCQRNKPRNTKPTGLLQPLPIPTEPWESMAMDFITKLPSTSDGYDSIAVMVDRLTKMVHLVPTTTTVTAEGVADLLCSHVIKHHGLPQSIISDRDSKFTANFWRQLMKLLGTKHRLSTAYHPQTDGQTERMNRTLEDMLRHYISPSLRDWATHLPLAEFAINNAKHASTGETPFYLNYGRHPASPLTRQFLTDAGRPPARTDVPAAQEFVARMQENLAKARTSLQAAQQRQKTLYDKGRAPHSFEVGDQVLINTTNIHARKSARKLLPKWIGPFRIQSLVGPVAAELELPPNYRMHNVFHCSLLKPYRSEGSLKPLGLPFPSLDRAPAFDLTSTEPLYAVEMIVGHRPESATRATVDKKGAYLVKWKGYSPEHNSWEPNKNFIDSVAQDEYWDYLARRRALT